MKAVSAWLLDLGEGLHAAVGEQEMIHVLPDPPTLFQIPRTPPYARQVMVWQDEVLPLINLRLRLAMPMAPERPMLVAVMAFQDHPGAAPRHGALKLGGPPVRIGVNDSLACELPEPQSDWRQLALACFEHANIGPVPVLDLHRLFSPPSGATRGF